MKLVGVRHAPATVSGVCYGRCDVAVADHAPVLDELTAALNNELCSATPREASAHDVGWRVLSSPTRRCWTLAVALAERLTLPVDADPRLQELHFGAWEGLRWDEIARSQPDVYAAWMGRWQELAPPDGESLPQFEARVRELTVELARGETPTLLITHAGVLRALRVVLELTSWEAALRWSVPHLVPIPLHVDPGAQPLRSRKTVGLDGA